MTYSFTEKEEILYERQIDELFNLTEWGISDVKKEPFVDATGKVWNVTAAQARRLKLADKTAHYTDQYARPIRSAMPGVPGGITPDSDPEDKGGVDPDIPILVPPLRVKPKFTKPKVVPTKPKFTKPKVVPTKPKLLGEPKKVVPTKPKLLGEPKKVVPTKPKRLSGPERFAPTKPKLLGEPKKVVPQKVIPHKVPQKVISTKPLSPNNQKAAKIAQEEIDRIIKKLQNNKTTLKQGTKLLTQLGKLEQLKPLRLNIPKAQIPPRFSLPAPTELKLTPPKVTIPEPPKVTVPKLDVPDPKLGVPDSKALRTEIEVTRKKLAAAQKTGNTKLTAKLTTHLKKQLGTYVAPGEEAQKIAAKAKSSAIQKAEAEALALRQEKQAAKKVTAQAAEKARLANIAKKAEEAALAKQAARQREVPKSPEQQKIEQDIDTKQKADAVKTQARIDAETKAKAEANRLKATAVKEPAPKSKMAQGMVQPKKGQGITSFAKQLGYDTVEEFEKANPKGVGVDKKTGNKFVKTGVSYIDKQAAGVANELANAKRLLNKETTKPKSKQNKVRIAKLEKQVDALSGKTTKPPPTVVGKPGKPAPGIKDMRKWGLGKGYSYSKVYATLAKKAAAKGLAKAGGYLVPGLNFAIIAWDVHELAVTTLNPANEFGRKYKQQDMHKINAILDSEATIAEKRKAIDDFGSGFGQPESEYVWDDDFEGNDPPLPFELKNINGRLMDINTVPIEKYEKVIANHVTDNMAPYTQKDLDVLINGINDRRIWHLRVAKRGPSERQLAIYNAKIKKLEEIRKTYPKTRKKAFKNLFTMMVDVHEQQLANGEVLDFTNKNTGTDLMGDGGRPVNDALENALVSAKKEDKEWEIENDARKKKKRDAGFMSFANWGDSSVGRFTAGIGDMFSDDSERHTAKYIEPGSEEDTSSATAGMGFKPTANLERNNDPEVVTAVGTPYGNDPGAPGTWQEYETLMKQVSLGFDLPIAVVRALAMQESGMHVVNGKLGPWSYTGDHTLGKKGAFGPFHVRSDPDKGASLEHFNETRGSTYTWKDLATNPMLAAAVGATYFKYWYDKTGGDAQKAYELYNGGPSGYMKTASIKNAKKFKERLDKFNESRNFANKSAILEGIAIAA
jgi:hypothetical protein